MQILSSISRKTLHLRREHRSENLSTTDLESQKIEASDTQRHHHRHYHNSAAHNNGARIINIHYRHGGATSPTVTDFAVDKRKQCFSSTAIHGLDQRGENYGKRTPHPHQH